MDAERFARREIVGHDLASEFNKRLTLPGEFQDETVAAKDARP